MFYLLSAIGYLRIRRSDRSLALWQDAFPTIFITVVLSAPFFCFASANYFTKDGFIDRFGEFTSSLTGFYIAGLLAVVTFSMTRSSLDLPISTGRAYLKNASQSDLEELTRRQYVSYLFGYLALASFLISTLSAVSFGLARAIVTSFKNLEFIVGSHHLPYVDILRAIGIISVNVLIGHLIITTLRGMHYLIYKIYDQVPTITKEERESHSPRVTRLPDSDSSF